MKQQTLGEFIQAEMKMRRMSIRSFAELVGVSHKIIGKFRYHGINPIYNKRPVGEPSLDFLAKLAKATSVDLAALVALIHPDVTNISPGDKILADQINALPPEFKDQVGIFIMGLFANRIDKGGKE